MRWPRVLTLALAVTSAAGLAAGAVTVTGRADAGSLLLTVLLTGVLGALVTGMGLLVAHHARDNWVAPVLAFMGLQPVALGLVLALPQPPDDRFVAVTQGSWMWLYVPVGLLLALFPNGRPVNRAGRVATRGLPATALIFQTMGTFSPLETRPGQENNPHPFPTSPVAGAVALACLPLFLGLLVLAATSLVQRYRLSDPLTRSRLRWLSVAGVLLPVTLLLCWTSYLVTQSSDLVLVGLLILYLGVPAAATIAIVRHDLYDVDEAVVVAVTVGLLASALMAVFLAASAIAGLVLGRESLPAAVAVTSVAAFALGAARGPMHRWVAGRLFPTRQAALRGLDDLRRRIVAGRGAPDEVVPLLATALRDPALSFVPGALPAPYGKRLVTRVALGRIPVGHLVSGPSANRRVPRAIAESAAILLETARLRSELAGALREVEASRERILLAGYDERRRLERDLHDGAQQRLVALGLNLRLLQRTLPGGHDVLQGELDGAVLQIAHAVSELRLLANGIRPSSLDDGLGVALAQLVRTVPVPLTLDLSGLDDPDGVSDVAGTTAYFVAAEAVTNAMKYAKARSIEVSARRVADRLVICVKDDGSGGAVPGSGSGLAGLQDRVAAAGGVLRIESRIGRGTLVEARLPCVS